MSAYAWIITEDPGHEPGGELPSRVGTMGPHDAPEALLEQLRAGQGQAFRMYYDGDDGLAYAGRYLGPDDDMFGPLDDFGTPDVGAVIIKYREGGKWVTL